MSRILITGSIAYDVLLGYEGSFADALQVQSFDQLSVSFFSPHFRRHHGGTGTNIAWNLRLLGGSPLLVGTVGTDGGSYCALLEERGIATTHIEQRSDSVTATAIIGTDNAERQIAFFHPGADALGHWPETALRDDRDDVAWAVIGPRNPLIMMQAVRWCSAVAIPALFDPGQLIIGLSPDELRSAITASRGVICNSYEWSLLQERTEWGVDEVLTHAAFLIVTRGEEGVELFEKAKMQKGKRAGHLTIPASKADRVLNPTGAGDALRAGLLFGLERQWSLTDCCRLGAVMGSQVVAIEGTQLDRLDLEEVWERVKVTYGEPLPT